MSARIRAFGVGCAKSGTHSLAAMFEDSLHAAHEPSAEILLALILRFRSGKIRAEQFQAGVAQYYAKFDLNLHVAHVNGTLIRLLVRLYPDAHYILTTRDCRSWLRSCVNFHVVTQQLNNTGPIWLAFRDVVFQPGRFPHRPEDAPLRDAGLYSLDSYLSYWAQHNAQVIATVPPAQLLIVPTAQLAHQSDRIAIFLGTPPDAANRTKTHMYAYPQARTPLSDLDPEYLAERLAFFEQKLLVAARERLPQNLAELAIGKWTREQV